MLKDPENQTAVQLNIKGEALFSKGAYPDALKAFEAALHLNPNTAEALNNKGTVLWQMGRQKESLKAFQQALDIRPTNRLIVLNVAGVLSAMGQTADLLRMLDIYLKQYPEDEEVNRILEQAKSRYHCTGKAKANESEPNSAVYKTTGVNNSNRLLMVIDYATQPYCMGDLIVYQAAAEALRSLKGLDMVDVCIISDPSIPPADENIRALVSAENRYYHLMQTLPVIQLNPRLGSVLIFDSLQSARNHIEAFNGSCVVWPAIEELEERKYLYYDAVRLLKDYHDAFNRIPALSFCQDLKRWYQAFVRQWVGTNIPVTVNLRNNGNFHDHRNSLMDEWEALFEHCRERYPVTFILTSSVEEVDPRFRSSPNVIIAKDHQTSMMQDLALIRFSAFHMGASSGPAAVPMLTDKPYLIVNCDMQPHLKSYRGAVVMETPKFMRFSFAAPLQRFSIGDETASFLIREFDRMYAAAARGRIN